MPSLMQLAALCALASVSYAQDDVTFEDFAVEDFVDAPPEVTVARAAPPPYSTFGSPRPGIVDKTVWPFTSPSQRLGYCTNMRYKCASKMNVATPHDANGDEEKFDGLFIGNFHKSLPHNEFGEVDPKAYRLMRRAIQAGTAKALEAVPAGGQMGFTSPVGGMPCSLDGPDTSSLYLSPPESIVSKETAAQMVEVYWMALLRDIPFIQWSTSSVVQSAVNNLNQLTGYQGPKDSNGKVTIQNLFRMEWPGVQAGPIASQLLYANFSMDGIPIQPKISPFIAGVDFLTSPAKWLEAQNGFPNGMPDSAPQSPVTVFPRNVRDLASVSVLDFSFSPYFRSLLILLGMAPNGMVGGPYTSARRQFGFSTWGNIHFADMVARVSKSLHHAWFQKWHVHRFPRPEAFGGLVHFAKTGQRNYTLHKDVLESPVLPLLFEYNRKRNAAVGENPATGSYLLPMIPATGSPSHPAYPSGHAVTAGATITALKFIFSKMCNMPWPNPKQPTVDGQRLVDYRGDQLTICGEINKLGSNIAMGRAMAGVHWRYDAHGGMLLGEQLAVQWLIEEKSTLLGEQSMMSPIEVPLLNGTVVRI